MENDNIVFIILATFTMSFTNVVHSMGKKKKNVTREDRNKEPFVF